MSAEGKPGSGPRAESSRSSAGVTSKPGTPSSEPTKAAAEPASVPPPAPPGPGAAAAPAGVPSTPAPSPAAPVKAAADALQPSAPTAGKGSDTLAAKGSTTPAPKAAVAPAPEAVATFAAKPDAAPAKPDAPAIAPAAVASAPSPAVKPAMEPAKPVVTMTEPAKPAVAKTEPAPPPTAAAKAPVPKKADVATEAKTTPAVVTAPAAKPDASPTAAPAPATSPVPGVPARAAPAVPPTIAKPGAEPVKAAPPAPTKPRRTSVPAEQLAPFAEVEAVLRASHRNPFGFLGMHRIGDDGPFIVRCFMPKASAVTLVDAASGEALFSLDRIREEGFYAAGFEAKDWFAYRLRLTTADGTVDVEDAYRFPPVLDDADIHLLAEGNHFKSYEKLGAQLRTMDGVAGVAFAVWAPHAGRVAVIGNFNDWDGRCHGMRLRYDCGIWEIFVPRVTKGAIYKFELKSETGGTLPDRTDPQAFQVESGPGAAAIVCDFGSYRWGDAAWMAKRPTYVPRESAISIYEMHLGSWRRKPEEGHRWLTYQEHADALVDYVKDLGFTHIELLPVSEYDDEVTLGMQPFAPYALTNRWGNPDQFRLLVDRCHQAGIGVLVDWVPNHFSPHPAGLAYFDGTALYGHPDPQQRYRPGQSALSYDFGRREVTNYLLSNALFWLDRYHLDGLRIPEVETMLYLNYGRSHGEWTPNRHGGPENLEAVDFLRHFNEEAYARFPGIFTVAEETSAWQRVSHPTFVGGLGFGFRWNRAWVQDTFRYFSRSPVHRKYYHDEILRGPGGAFQENYVLPLSHHEVAIGKGTLIRKMPGDRWQKFANLRTLYSLMYTHPGKKLMFMGDEFAQDREWNSDISLDWHLLGDPLHAGVQRLVRDLNALYRGIPALHELDCDPGGFAWIDCNDSDQSIISFLRMNKAETSLVVVICNFTPVPRQGYRVGVPQPGYYVERLNSDAEAYGGANIGNAGGTQAEASEMHGRPYALTLNIPPFATVILERKAG